MKKLLLCAAALVLSALTVSAQRKGTTYFGGMFGIKINSVGVEGALTTQSTVSIAPELGRFVTDRLRLGGAVAYHLSSNYGFSTHGVTVSPTLAYYVELCDRFYYTPELQVGFAYASVEEATGYGVGAGLAFGAFEFQPSPRWGIAFNLFSLEYSYLSVAGMGINSVTLHLGISPTVGVRYYF